MSDKKILDATCGSRTIWFNKEHPAAVYCDIRKEELTGIWKSGDGQSERACYIDPDIHAILQIYHSRTNRFSWLCLIHHI